jgi:hypothetical protein
MSEEQALQVRPGRGYRRDRLAKRARHPAGTDRGQPGSDRCRRAVAFVGPCAGLSRMAGAGGTLVVPIAGCTDPTNETATPYAVIDRPVRNGWRNAARQRVDRPDAPWCVPCRHVASIRRPKADHRRIGDRDLEAGPGGDRNGRAGPARANASLPTARTTRS